jgi:hypothetical protein
MASTINASTASGGGVITTADASGILQLQTAGVTGLTIDASQNVTLAKGLTVGASAAPAFSAYRSTNQSSPSGSFTRINCDIEEFDTNSNYSSFTFTPTVAGYYQVQVAVLPAGNVSQIAVYIYKNGNVAKASNVNINGSALASALVQMNGSTDYLEGYVYMVGASPAILGSSAYSYFQAFLARSA